MKCTILHVSSGRIRVRMAQSYMSLTQADILEYYLWNQPGVTDVKVFDRSCDAIVRFTGEQRDILQALAAFSYSDEETVALVPDHTGRALNREFEDRLAGAIMRRVISQLFFPAPLRAAITLVKSIRYIWKGIKSLRKGHLEVALLDATAITVSLLRCDFATAGSTMFLLHIGEILEEWTHKKSVDDLARTMSLQVEKVWMQVDDQELLVPLQQVHPGDRIIIRTGSMIPLDGKVVSGEASVNQASLTGESLPVHKGVGSYVCAGTVVEEGSCVVCVEKASGDGRYDRIVRMIEESEKLKSSTEARASHLADRLVPFTLGGTVLVYALTRNVTKALAVLMVDFSCALKLALPIAVLSAMRESSHYGISVKGGRFLEAVSDADTIVFDKTGTMTHATPRVAEVIPFGGNTETEMLRLAACLEEHYPHSIANAVVAEAELRKLAHEECHSTVEYVVAHGISGLFNGQKVVIGSHHFVFEDEGCVIPEGEEQRFHDISDAYSHLYMAISGKLAAVICIEDPLREEAPLVVSQLRELGFRRIVMMTGDSERTARSVAQTVGVDEYYAEVLPEDKANFIRREHEAGHKVVMIGDGVNDSPALSEADAGIAISSGAAIAREIADITISANDLYCLVTLKKISTALMGRINWNYRFIMAFNLLLIALGVGGVLQPATSALLHNISTIGISMYDMKSLLEQEN